MQARAWNANNDPEGVPAIAEGTETEASLGGPLLRDRLWFFGSYRYLYRNTQVSRTPDQLRSILAVVPDWQAFDNRTRQRHRHDDR